jgi:plasmid stability protein
MTADADGAMLHVEAPTWRYGHRMPSIQVKDVPDDVHAALRLRAAAAGRSLQEHLLERLIEEARTPTVQEVLDRAGGRAGGRAGFEAAAEAVRAVRDGG